jgi:4-hydroxybenzoate polyprenyltransferase
VGASHPGPAAAVTAITALLAAGLGHRLGSGAVVTAAVGAGQLGIGWSNDLIDAARDRQVGRQDKPLARGEVTESVVRGAAATALLTCGLLSLACGVRAAGVHLLLGVTSGLLYNLRLKSTPWSPAPYAVAFGSLPAVVTLALPRPQLPPAWMLVTGALLGVGAHLLNALPDLADDARTGVSGWPHRLGARRVRVLAPLVLVAASAVTVFGPATRVPAWSWVVLTACGALGVFAGSGRGRLPFVAAVSIAVLDVVALVVRG